MTAASILILAGCGSSEEPPVEQIVVREPGEQPAVPAALNRDDQSAGEAAFAACIACHSVEKNAASGAGPNLHGVLGRSAAAVEDFAYSEALASSGITWTESELDSFLENPTGKVPGTTMVAGSVADPDRRSAIVDFLASRRD